MKKDLEKKRILGNHVGCYGNFDPADAICRRFCALNLRCAIERDQNDQLEILEDLLDAEGMSLKIN